VTSAWKSRNNREGEKGIKRGEKPQTRLDLEL
jgi:hypothetical protein